MTKDSQAPAMVRVVGYSRVSTEEQADSGAGLAAQEAAIRDEVDRRGWGLVEICRESAASGKSIKGRPGLAVALELVESYSADVLMVSKLDRLSRSLLDFANLMERAQKRGWNLIALDLGIDLSTPAGEFMASVMASAAQWERRIIGQRTRDALAVKRAAGVRLGRPRTLPDRVVADILKRREAGASLTEIATALNDRGTPTAQGGQRWYPSTVRAVLGSR